MKKIPLIILFQFFCSSVYSLNVTIIESRSANIGHDMDLKWSALLTSIGHTPTIVPQTTLDNTAFFASTDILIVSSGIIALPASRVAIILQFLQTGKPVYLQCEYLNTYTTNIGFASLVSSLGGTFSWVSAVTGDLQPVTVLGTFATTPNAVPTLSYYWYSYSGNGDCNTVPFLRKSGLNHGFQYVPTNRCLGTIAATTDQDWVRANTSTALMHNIIAHLLSPPATCTPGSPCSLLGTKLVDFTATAKDYSVLLNWTTENETNNDFFTVEKSVDGVQFESVGEVDGAGTSFSPLNYELIDKNPYIGTSYYRLKETDFFGNPTYSELRVVHLSQDENLLNLYPNPVDGHQSVHISFSSHTEASIELIVRDYLGRTVLQKNYLALKGINTLEFSVEGLSAGLYVVALVLGDGERKMKFVKR